MLSRPSRYFDAPRPIAFAHRGGAKVWPENTLAAFRGAIAAGCTHIETDMHLSADAEVVLFHDQTLDRTTDGRGPLRAQPYKALASLDAGFHFRNREGQCSFRGQGERIVTLAQLAALDASVFINIEMKPRDARVAPRLLEEIDRLGIADRVLVASARHAPLRAFRRLARGRIPSSASRREIIEFVARVRAGATWPRRWMPPYQALQVPVHRRGFPVITPAFVTAAHRHGVQVHAWTIDSPEQMQRLVRLGVDGIMSDLPELLTRTLDCASGDASPAR